MQIDGANGNKYVGLENLLFIVGPIDQVTWKVDGATAGSTGCIFFVCLFLGGGEGNIFNAYMTVMVVFFGEIQA